MKNDIIGFIR